VIHSTESAVMHTRKRSSASIRVELKDAVTKALEKAANHANQDQLETAAALLESLATGIGKVDHRVHFMVGIVANQRNMTQKAIESFKRAVFLDKKLTLGHFYLAILYEREGRIEVANKHFRNVAKLLEGAPDEMVLEGSQDLGAGRLRQIVQTHLREGEDFDNGPSKSRG
jgi:chemotaxis protein methyltransferase CheR